MDRESIAQLVRDSLAGGRRPWRTLILEVTFNAFTIEWVFRLSQNDWIDDGMAGNLGCQKCFPFRKIYICEFHEPVAGNYLSPFVFHDPAFWPDGRAALR
jgi:hypothetical protein